MIQALVAVLSAPGLFVACRLLRPLPPLARDMPVSLDEMDGVRFGYDFTGLVD